MRKTSRTARLAGKSSKSGSTSSTSKDARGLLITKQRKRATQEIKTAHLSDPVLELEMFMRQNLLSSFLFSQNYDSLQLEETVEYAKESRIYTTLLSVILKLFPTMLFYVFLWSKKAKTLRFFDFSL